MNLQHSCELEWILGSSGSEGRPCMDLLLSATFWSRSKKAERVCMVQSECTQGGLFPHNCRNGNNTQKGRKFCRHKFGRAELFYDKIWPWKSVDCGQIVDIMVEGDGAKG